VKKYSNLFCILLFIVGSIDTKSAHASHLNLSCSEEIGPFVDIAKGALAEKFKNPNPFCVVEVIDQKERVIVVFVLNALALGEESSEGLAQRVMYDVTINKKSKMIEKASFVK
jgi:hypothetical protein